MTRKHSIATALALLLSAPLAHAIDTAPVSAMQNAAVARPALGTGPAAFSNVQLKVDEYKETDVWGRIRSGYAIPDISNNLVERHVRSYSSKPDYMARISGRASLYLFHVVQELEKRNMPTELALLPVIESAFNPQALSTADAAGIWQFVPGTGRDFNLKQNTFKDERRGVLASTDAALTYLQRLYTMFGDWQLALAAYNWGEGNVQRAIKKNQSLGKPTDFESLAELMPAETRNYVPKLQAVKNIVANPGQYNVSLPAIENQPYFTAIDKTSDIDLVIAAQLAEMSVAEFKALNPQFKRPVITGDDRTKILLPQKNAEKFHLNLAQWGQALSTWTTHKITGAKESIASLASKFGTTPEVIRQANNIPAQTRLKAGSTILVPKTSATMHSDIAENIVDGAVMALEADRGDKRSGARTQRFKTKAVAGTRVSRGTDSRRKHR
ncbi:transglycosylase SLT domain-containing protein [Massilia sp. Dwa41.01b]|uniref:transglycosylase SLT domain-containing protein n=1 Tax=unclassified Massilia TaxID=2609279 RepID=UPI001600B7E2|nr:MULTISPECIES: transglycosylase SLT domain-containing protein [unclassified Massilia]QNA88654.1 transglycosylase SLT domain-containing protein [Massilia sp. Dwa41.01b]QNA99552.1 transglycosylase SLT domain-containing protein [Massilia sp. Se16.2.3]